MSTITTRSGKGSPLSHTELDNNFSNLNTDKLENISEDTTPTLGGDLDGGASNISNVATVTATTFSGSGASLTNIPGANITGTIGNAQITSGSVVQHQANLSITESQIGDLQSYLTTVAINGVSDVTITTPADNEVLAYNSGTDTWINQTASEAGLLTSFDVVDDTTPQLGGDLSLNSNDITGTGNVDITGSVIAQSSINTQTGTTYTFVLADASKLVTLNNAAAITLTIPTNSSVAFPVGTKIDLAQLGAGQVTVAGAGGVTVNSTPTLKLRAQYSAATCIKTATDTWLLVGDLEAAA